MSLEKGFLSSGELARLSGISADTLRYYERNGVLARPRRARNNYREYPASAVERVRMIRRALAVGFTIRELARIFDARDSGQAPCRDVRDLAMAKLEAIESRIREMRSIRRDLQSILQDWNRRLSAVRGETRAHLLESLSSGENTPVARRALYQAKHDSKEKKR